ncbi:MAG: hypothetical protein ACI83O_000458 [Patescibacteria group bacterium]|jgi:hypothetical protein
MYMRMINDTKGAMLQKYIVQIILVVILITLFLYATAGKVDTRGVKQQVLERQVALLIDSASPGMEFTIKKDTPNGLISDIELRNGRVFVTVNGLGPISGYRYITLYSVLVVSRGDSFVVVVG